MIVTHCQNAQGHRRIYIGGKSSIEGWIEPESNGRAWTFHIDVAVAGVPLSPYEQRQCATYLLLQLARILKTAPERLKGVPFDCIAALHNEDPYTARRAASSKRKGPEHKFVAAAPDVSVLRQADRHQRSHSKTYARS